MSLVRACVLVITGGYVYSVCINHVSETFHDKRTSYVNLLVPLMLLVTVRRMTGLLIISLCGVVLHVVRKYLKRIFSLHSKHKLGNLVFKL